MPVWSKEASILNLKCNKLQMLNAIEKQHQLQQQQQQQQPKTKYKQTSSSPKKYMKKKTHYKLELYIKK